MANKENHEMNQISIQTLYSFGQIILAGFLGALTFFLVTHEQNFSIKNVSIPSKILISIIIPIVIVFIFPKNNTQSNSILAFSLCYSNELLTYFLNKIISLCKNIIDSTFVSNI